MRIRDLPPIRHLQRVRRRKHPLLIAICAVSVAVSTNAAAQSPAPSTRTIGEPARLAIFTAMESEMAPIRAATTITGTRVVNGRTVWMGQIAGHDVALIITGSSMVNAAMMTQAMIDQFTLRGIVFSGIAGGVNPSLHVGDVTIPSKWGNYQEHLFARETANGFEPTRSNLEFGHYKGMYPQGTSVPVRGARPDSLARQFWFGVDTGALSLARRAAAGVALQRCTPSGDCAEHAPRVISDGTGVSGPTFVDNAAYREWVWNTFHADALDMETAAVAIVAYQANVPYIAFRGLSDLAGGGATRNTVRSLGRLAAENAAAVTLAYLKTLPRPDAAAAPPAATSRSPRR